MRQVGEPGQVAQSLSKLAEMLNRRGELARVPALYQEALLLYRKAGDDLGVAATLIESATGLYWFSLADAATIQTVRHRLQEAQTIVTRLGTRYWIAYCSWLAALLSLSEGEMARAYSLSQESLAIFGEIGDRWGVAWALHVLGRVEAQRGDLAAARSWYQQSLTLTLELGESISPRTIWKGWQRASCTGRADSCCAAMGSSRSGARSDGSHGGLFYRGGYEQAVATARAKMGEQAFAAAWAEGRTRRLYRLLPPRASRYYPCQLQPPGQELTSPDGLTAREVEVLHLLAQGLTSAQIAEQLIIGVVTVNFHVRSIYSKLGVNLTSAATRYALEHQLV